MYMKFIWGIITIIVIILSGTKKVQDFDESIDEGNGIIENVILQNNYNEEEAGTSNEIIENITKNVISNESKNSNTSKAGQQENSTQGSNKTASPETTIENKEVMETKTTEDNQKNNIEQQVTKENANEPIYNASETSRIIAAIDKYAKQNNDLIGENGEKLYSVRVSKDAMKYDYFSPYRDNQIEAKVANVFSCTFVVYAVDIKNTTRYYIGIE